MESEELVETQSGIEPVEVANQEESTPSETDSADMAGETSPEDDVKPSRGVQKRIDELVRAREDARRDSDHWREMAMRQMPGGGTEKPAGTVPDASKPKVDDFATYDEWVEAVTDWRAENKIRQMQQQFQQQSQDQRRMEWLSKAEAKYADFRDNVSRINISEFMRDAIMDSPQGADLAYYLGKNPSEANRIFNLPGTRQIYELGKLEAKLSGPPQKTKTQAPAATQPVGGKDVPAKKPEDMTMDEYTQWRESGGGR